MATSRKLIILLSTLITTASINVSAKTIKAVNVTPPDSAHKQVVKIGSLDELMQLFDEYNYNSKQWALGNREVPRLTFNHVSEKWKKTSQNIPVKLKKQIFFRLMAPLVLMSNEKIMLERKMIQTLALNDPRLINIARKYHVIKTPSKIVTEKDRALLLNKVDIMPPSLALAQAAEESGWASSRFTEEGNAFFGQWDFSGNGMVPKQQRKELGNYGLARFDSPLASVEGYMFNINTTSAYQGLRDLRVKLRAEQKEITGLVLAGTLERYSERGQAYIESIRSMIRYNKLQEVDEAYLSDKPAIVLVAVD